MRHATVLSMNPGANVSVENYSHSAEPWELNELDCEDRLSNSSGVEPAPDEQRASGNRMLFEEEEPSDFPCWD